MKHRRIFRLHNLFNDKKVYVLQCLPWAHKSEEFYYLLKLCYLYSLCICALSYLLSYARKKDLDCQPRGQTSLGTLIICLLSLLYFKNWTLLHNKVVFNCKVQIDALHFLLIIVFILQIGFKWSLLNSIKSTKMCKKI